MRREQKEERKANKIEIERETKETFYLAAISSSGNAVTINLPV